MNVCVFLDQIPKVTDRVCLFVFLYHVKNNVPIVLKSDYADVDESYEFTKQAIDYALSIKRFVVNKNLFNLALEIQKYAISAHDLAFTLLMMTCAEYRANGNLELFFYNFQSMPESNDLKRVIQNYFNRGMLFRGIANLPIDVQYGVKANEKKLKSNGVELSANEFTVVVAAMSPKSGISVSQLVDKWCSFHTKIAQSFWSLTNLEKTSVLFNELAAIKPGFVDFKFSPPIKVFADFKRIDYWFKKPPAKSVKFALFPDGKFSFHPKNFEDSSMLDKFKGSLSQGVLVGYVDTNNEQAFPLIVYENDDLSGCWKKTLRFFKTQGWPIIFNSASTMPKTKSGRGTTSKTTAYFVQEGTCQICCFK